MNNIQVLLLAGGQGIRMWPITKDKNLLEFLGKPLINIIINELESSGLHNITVVCNQSNNKEIKNYCNQEKNIIKTVIQKKPLGQADAILTAKNFINRRLSLLIVNADDLFAPSFYKNLIKSLNNKSIVLSGIKVDSYIPGGYFQLNGRNIKGILEKPGEKKIPSKFWKTVVDYFEKPDIIYNALINCSSKNDDVYETALNNVINKNTVKLNEVKAKFAPLKYPWHILDISQLVLKYYLKPKITKSAEISCKAILDGPVFIGENVKILEGACIRGPAFIDNNTIIGNNTLIIESIIGKKCVVGFNTEITRSWIGKGNWFHSNYIGDSVIEGGCNFGSGTKLANLRLDEKEINVIKDKQKIPTHKLKLGCIVGKDVKLGINTSVMPGRLIGAKSYVKPGIVVYNNVKN